MEIIEKIRGQNVIRKVEKRKGRKGETRKEHTRLKMGTEKNEEE